MNIVTYPNEVLTKKASMITKNELKGDVKKTLLEMKKYVESENGAAGLALPQLGISKRGFVAKLTANDKDVTEIFINPRIIPFDRERVSRIEGCLSIPDKGFWVERVYGAEIVYQGLNGKTKKLKLKGFNARVVQHEYDHLNGVLISEIGIPNEEKIRA